MILKMELKSHLLHLEESALLDSLYGELVVKTSVVKILAVKTLEPLGWSLRSIMALLSLAS
jgi:hypothetical protein